MKIAALLGTALAAAMCVSSTDVYYTNSSYPSEEYSITPSEPVVESIYEDGMPIKKVKIMSPKKTKKTYKASQRAIKKHQMMKGMIANGKMTGGEGRRLLWVNGEDYNVGSEPMVKIGGISSGEIGMATDEYVSPKISMFQKRLFDERYGSKPDYLLRKKYEDNSDLIARRLVVGGPDLDPTKPDMVVITSVGEESEIGSDKKKRFGGIRGKGDSSDDKKKWFDGDMTKKPVFKRNSSDSPTEPETRRLMYASDETIPVVEGEKSYTPYTTEYVTKDIYESYPISSEGKTTVHDDTQVVTEKGNRKYQKKQQKIIDNMLVKSEKEKNKMLKKKFKTSRKNSTGSNGIYLVRNLSDSPYVPHKYPHQYTLEAPYYETPVEYHTINSSYESHYKCPLEQCNDEECLCEPGYDSKNYEIATEMAQLFTCQEMCQFIEQKKQMIDPYYEPKECCCCSGTCTTGCGEHMPVSSPISTIITHAPTAVSKLN